MNRRAEIKVASVLEADPAEVWERVITPKGINGELMPLMRMTLPRGVTSIDPEQIKLGERIGRSWILLFGLLPVDFDDLTLERLEPGRGFLERSTMLSQRSWEHERRLRSVGERACLITDRVAWEPRLPLPGSVLRPMFTAIFAHRHRRLRGHFGGRAAAPSH
jgi:hypothetical protein